MQEITCDARTRRALGNKDLACDHCDYKTRSATLLKRHNDSIHKENLVMRQSRQWNKRNWRERYVLNADRNSTRRTLSRSTWVQRMGENFPQSNNIIILINWRGTDQMRPIKLQVKRRMSTKVSIIDKRPYYLKLV